METGIYNPFKLKSLLIPMIYECFGSALLTISYGLGQRQANVRAASYYIGWMLACTVSGAHFNPAITLAVFIFERKRANTPYFLVCLLVQLIGCFLGVLISFLLSSYCFSGMAPDPLVTTNNDPLYYTMTKDDKRDIDQIYYGRILLIEFLQTFSFVSVILIIKYKKSLRGVNEAIKGLAVAITYFVCLLFTIGDGSSLNPWFGFAQSMLAIAEQNIGDTYTSVEITKYVFWCYILGPALGGLCAGLVQIPHHYVESLTYDEQDRRSDFSNISRPTYGHNLAVQTLLSSNKSGMNGTIALNQRENTQVSKESSNYN